MISSRERISGTGFFVFARGVSARFLYGWCITNLKILTFKEFGI
jgi:hypothetical protein